MQTSNLISATQTGLFEYLLDLERLPGQLAGKIDIQIEQKPERFEEGSEFAMMMTRYGIASRVICRIEQFQPPSRFTYRLISGTFKSWRHTMILDAHDATQTRLTEIVDYVLPLGLFGYLADDLFMNREISKLLKLRATRIEAELADQPTSSETRP